MRAFIIRPFGTKRDSAGREINFDDVHEHLIKPALEKAGIEGGGDTGEIIDAGNIHDDIFSLIIEADLVLCDITIHNANVFYELGIRHSLRKKCTVLIKGMPSADATPFDINADRYLQYDLDAPKNKLEALCRVIRATLASDRETDSPIFKMLQALPEVDPAVIQVIPNDLSDEIGRAAAARSAGWLRLLASEVRGYRFQWPALRAIGTAQWKMGDYDGARATWELIRGGLPKDLTANLGLANSYDREFKTKRDPALLERSNRAIETVLTIPGIPAHRRAEALALRGRNCKTLWRLDFEMLGTAKERRERAANRGLLNSYEAYHDAYLVDLNHFYSGLNALQMGMTALSLAEDAGWYDLFDTNEEADEEKAELQREVDVLRSAVKLAIEAERARLKRRDKTDLWVEISRADYLFLTAPAGRDQFVVQTYRNSGLEQSAFEWQAAKGQLTLFAALDIGQPGRAQKVIDEIDRRVELPATDLPLHVIIAVGHRIDTPTRLAPRFPASKEAEARLMIQAELQKLKVDGQRLRVLASGAPGTDIIVHEVCKELGIECVMCLPMPRDEFSAFAFRDQDDCWRNRFLALSDTAAPLCLSDQRGLPKWLHGSAEDPWERGNRWVFEMAKSSKAPYRTLIALWDRKPGDMPGGTADMVDIARRQGGFGVNIIEAAQLVAMPLDVKTG